MSRTAAQIVARLTALTLPGGTTVPAGSTIHRTRAGYWQRAAGAWSWHLVDPDGAPLPVGSQVPVTTLLRCRHEWDVDRGRYTPDISVDPCRACMNQYGGKR